MNNKIKFKDNSALNFYNHCPFKLTNSREILCLDYNEIRFKTNIKSKTLID